MNIDNILQQAEKLGFHTAQAIPPKTLKLNPEVRKMCMSNKCRQYDVCWTCPPACGTLEEMEHRIRSFNSGVLLQSVGAIEDSFDFEAMEELEKQHQKRFADLVAWIKTEVKDILPLSAGCCRICPTCTYPDAPCRFPDLAFVSLEGAGILVSELCADNDVPYYYGAHRLAYTAALLMNSGV